MLIWRNSKTEIPKTGRKKDGNASASDADLVCAARRGDKRAFVEIVARHQAMVCGIALGILGEFAASEDAGQETFLTAWRKLHDLREPERLRAWLGQIARNAALGQLRRRRGHESLQDALVLPDESPTPDEAAADEDEATLVRAFLARLPETYRLPLVLYYRDGKSIRGVAETLDISEDAVKQRLARGREMLRDRMSGMVETVLTRTAPTAVFTMAIAVAIGALAAPAAVAGSAFTAISVATSSVSASANSSSASLLTAMSTSKSFLVATALVAVAFIPVGYHISNDRQPAVGPKAASQVETYTPAPDQPSAPSFEGSALFAEWRALHEKYGTNASAMPALYKAISDIKEPFRRRAFHTALIAEWVRVDGPGGLAFILSKGHDSSQRRQFVEEWLALDARAAVDALLSSGRGWEAAGRESLTNVARRVPSRLADVVQRLPKSDSYWDTSVRDAFAVLAATDLSSARRAAEAVTGANREQALAGIAQNWAKTDFTGAVAWAKALPDGTDRDEIIRAALLGKASVDPAGALESVGLVPPGGRYAYANTTTGARVLTEAAQADFDATIGWVAAHPGRFGREDLFGLSQVVTERLNADAGGFLSAYAAEDKLTALLPAIGSAILNSASGQRSAIWDWLKHQPDNDATKSLRNDVLNTAAYQDPDLALRLVADIPHTPEGDLQVQELARCLFNGGNMLHRFDTLYEQAPDRLRQPLMDAAFKLLSADNLGNPQQWIARLPQLPETSRANGAASIARAWAQQIPEEAITWAASLSPGEARSGAMAAIASTWAAKDAHGAADWIDSMTRGADRDRSAESLAVAIADKFPHEAWEWALSIGDTAMRDRAATQTVKIMAARDSAIARQWIDSGPFTPATKAALQSAIEGSSPSQR